jgi:putative ABC transport system permease protein
MRDDELDEELRADFEIEIEQLMRTGMTRAEAEASARRSFGNVTLVKEVTREMWGRGSLERFAQDLRFGARLLCKNPAFTLAVALSIALGVGSETAVFTVVKAVLLRPLEFHNPDRLVAVAELPTGSGPERTQASGPDFDDFRDQNTSFERLAAVIPRFTFPLTDQGEPIMVRCTGVSKDFFDVLGLKPILGRVYRAEDYQADGGQIILSYGFWQRRFGGDPHVLGKKIYLNHEPHEIIAVMPPTADLFNDTDLWSKYISYFSWARQRGNKFLTVVGALRPDVTVAHARQELEAIYRRMPGVSPTAAIDLTPLKDQVVGGVRPALLVLLGAVALVLLIACANVANLLLARGAARQREIATRFALGASRGRLIRQFLTESLLLSAVGGAAGVLMAIGLVRLLLILNPSYLPRTEAIHVDLPVLAFALSVSLAAGLIFSIVPVAAASRESLHDKVRTRGVANMRDRWTRGALVAAELGLAVILLTGAGLLARSFWRVLSVSPGFRPEHVLTLRLRVTDQQTASSFYPDLLDRVTHRPGVQAAAVSDCLPTGFVAGADLLLPGRIPDPAHVPTADACFISGGYFRALGISLLAGRPFDQHDDARAPLVAVVSESVARQLWPGENPLGKQIAVNYRSLGRPAEETPAVRQVVGVVADARQRGLESPSRMGVYLPYHQDATRRSLRAMVLFARTADEPESAARSLQSDIRTLAPDVPILSAETLEAIVRHTLAPRTFSLVLLGCFAGFALLLAAAGLYGVVSYAVTRRVREIGIRMALGARKPDVLRTVLGQELRWLSGGLIVGLAGAAAVARLLRGMLFGIEPTDAWTFGGVILLLLFVALAACWNPATRAVRVDPVTVLREE